MQHSVRSARFLYIWQYRIKSDRRTEFLAAYKPGGDWTRLFARDPSYIETRLLQDLDDVDRYITIDVWMSKPERNAFRERYAREFADLDKTCEAFTVEESFLGDFIESDRSSA